MTQGWGGWPGRATGVRHGRAGSQQDAATMPGEAYDTADYAQGRAAARAQERAAVRAQGHAAAPAQGRVAWLVGCVAIHSIVS